MRQYPIWNNVTACIYKGGKSWGAQKEAGVSVLVGTSSSNSHEFCNHRTTHRTFDCGTQEFRFFVDDKVVKRAIIRFKKRASDRKLEFIGINEEWK